MKEKILTFFGYIIGGIGAVIITPFVITYYLIVLFWKVYGSSIIGFFIIAIFGGTMEECFKYGAGMGFFVGVYLKYRELKKQK